MRRLPVLSILLVLISSVLLVLNSAPGSAATTGTNLVVNGSFEDPVIAGPFSHLSSIPGWTVCSGPGTKIELNRNDPNIQPAAEGSQLTELDSDGSVGICQTLTTEVGRRYKLRFAFSARPGYGTTENRLEVSFGGSLVTGSPLTADGSALSSTNFTYYEYIVTATATSSVLEFRDVGVSNTVGTVIDDVSVAPIECKSLSSSPWDMGSTWDCGVVPAADDDVRIRSGHTVELGSDSHARNLTLEDFSSLTDPVGNIKLTIEQDWVNDSGEDAFVPHPTLGNTVQLRGSQNGSVKGAFKTKFSDLEIDKSLGKLAMLMQDVDVNRDLKLKATMQGQLKNMDKRLKVGRDVVNDASDDAIADDPNAVMELAGTEDGTIKGMFKSKLNDLEINKPLGKKAMLMRDVDVNRDLKLKATMQGQLKNMDKRLKVGRDVVNDASDDAIADDPNAVMELAGTEDGTIKGMFKSKLNDLEINKPLGKKAMLMQDVDVNRDLKLKATMQGQLKNMDKRLKVGRDVVNDASDDAIADDPNAVMELAGTEDGTIKGMFKSKLNDLEINKPLGKKAMLMRDVDVNRDLKLKATMQGQLKNMDKRLKVGRDVVNDASDDAIADDPNAVMELAGTEDGTIKGMFKSKLNDLEINKPLGKKAMLMQDVDVNRDLKLKATMQGQLKNMDKRLKVGRDVVNDASDDAIADDPNAVMELAGTEDGTIKGMFKSKLNDLEINKPLGKKAMLMRDVDVNRDLKLKATMQGQLKNMDKRLKVGRDVVNDASDDAIADDPNAVMELAGTEDGTIKGMFKSKLNDLEINKPLGKKAMLMQDVDVNRDLKLKATMQGQLKNMDKRLKVGRDVVNDASDDAIADDPNAVMELAGTEDGTIKGMFKSKLNDLEINKPLGKKAMLMRDVDVNRDLKLKATMQGQLKNMDKRLKVGRDVVNDASDDAIADDPNAVTELAGNLDGAIKGAFKSKLNDLEISKSAGKTAMLMQDVDVNRDLKLKAVMAGQLMNVNKRLKVSRDVVNDAHADAIADAANAVLEMAGNLDGAIKGTFKSKLNDLEISKSAGKTAMLMQDVDVNRDLKLKAGMAGQLKNMDKRLKVSRDLVNDASADAIADDPNAVTELAGTNDGAIKGAFKSKLNDLEINKSAGKTAMLMQETETMRDVKLNGGTLSMMSSTLKAGRDLVNNTGPSALNPGTGTAMFVGATDGGVKGAFATTFTNLTIQKTGPAKVTAVASVTATSKLRVQTGKYVSGSNYHDVEIDPGATMEGQSGGTISITGDWTNDGNFVANTSTVAFVGGAPQMIGGATPTTFHNLTVDNPGGGVTLDTDATVNGHLDLETPLESTGSAELTLGPGATVKGPSPTISISDVSKAEGLAGTTNFDFTVSLSNTTSQAVTVAYTTADGSATLANNDYQLASSTATIPAGQLSTTITVNVKGDATRESDETFLVHLSNPNGGTIIDGDGVGTIQNDDAVPSLAIDDVAKVEGNSGKTAFTFTVSLSNPGTQTITVDFATADGTATLANNDYQATSGTLTFAPKTTSVTAQITVSVNGDISDESNETFSVNLTNVTGGATIADGTGIGTITNDDPIPTLSIDSVTHGEGNGGKTLYSFTVTKLGTSGQPVTVNFVTADGTATVANNDYQATSGSVTFPPKTPGGTATITVSVNGDVTQEANETFLVQLSNPTNAALANPSTGVGTIVNDDGAPGISIDDIKVTEGNSGKTFAVLTLHLSRPSAAPLTTTVDYSTMDGSATTSDQDYQAATGTVTFPDKTTSATLTIAINGDGKCEPQEVLFVNLIRPINGVFLDSQANVLINNDDDCVPPVIQVKAPNGGENVIVGTTTKIAWNNNDTNPCTVDILLARDGVNYNEAIVVGTPDDGSFPWAVNGPGTNIGSTLMFTAKVKVVAHDCAGNSGADESDSGFSIFDVATTNLVSLFESTPVNDGVELRWELAAAAEVSELELERGDSEMGPWVAIDAERRLQGAVTMVVDHSAEPGETYYYRLSGTMSGERMVLGMLTGKAGERITEFALKKVYPNPTHGMLRMEYTVPREARVKLRVMDVAGRVVAKLMEGTLRPGRYQAMWNGRGSDGAKVGAGMYFVQFQVPGKDLVHQAVIAQ